jgi:hypothetical protein
LGAKKKSSNWITLCRIPEMQARPSALALCLVASVWRFGAGVSSGDMRWGVGAMKPSYIKNIHLPIGMTTHEL